jgi:hypothetical protein
MTEGKDTIPRRGVRYLIILTIIAGLATVGTTAPSAASTEDMKIALSLAQLLRSARTVISKNQNLINDANKGDKGLTGEAVLKLAIANYVKAKGKDPRSHDPHSRESRLLQAQMTSIREVMEDHQVTINRRGLGFKGFVPEYYGAGCLKCNGEPKGELDVTVYPKEGGRLDELGEVISITLYRSRFSIFVRLVVLSTVLLVMTIGSVTLLSWQFSRHVEATNEQSQLVTVVKTANSASKTFGDLKYWLTDLAVSLFMRSERKVREAQATLDGELVKLEPYAGEAVAVIRREVDALMNKALMAVDAYTDDERVIGNSLMAAGRAHIRAVDERLGELVNKLEAEAFAKSAITSRDAKNAVDISIIIVVGASVFGFGLTFLVLRSITVPLNNLVEAMSAITEGNLNIELPKPGHQAGGKGNPGPGQVPRTKPQPDPQVQSRQCADLRQRGQPAAAGQRWVRRRRPGTRGMGRHTARPSRDNAIEGIGVRVRWAHL